MRDSGSWPHGRAIGTGLTILLLLGLAACNAFAEVPVLSERSARSDATLSELREWVAEEIDAVIEVTGVEYEWVAQGSDGVRWVEERERIFEGQRLSMCSFRSGQADPAAVRIDLMTDPLDQDPFLLLDRVRELWTDRGWEVRNRFEAEQVESRSQEIIAEQEDGSMMIFRAGEAAGGRMLGLMVTSACSNDPSVAR